MSFPIDPYLGDIAKSLQNQAVVLLKAEPGAGKTTRVPLHLMGVFKKILVIEPRRLAARLAAEWVAEQAGCNVGEDVGYQIRLESRLSPRTRLLFVTEGILTRYLIQDPDLSSFDLIVLDEFHERHVHSDIALALIRLIQERRPDLKLLIMSATLDLSALESYLGGIRGFDVPGRVFPVAVSYHPSALNVPVAQQVSQAARAMLADPRCEGHILVFLSGIGPILSSEKALEGCGADVIPLTADLSGNYAKISKNPERRKIILATNVAETSLTLPGVRGVIDTGTARMLGYAPWSGLPTLEEKKISQASCVQRTGRAGRTGPGLCYRLFSESDFHARQKFTEAEIQRVDLCQILLEIQGIFSQRSQAWERLPWFEKPKPAIVEQNVLLLQQLGAIDPNGSLTRDGERMAQLPLHPRLGRIVLEGERLGILAHALLAALIINEGLLTNGALPNARTDCDVCLQISLLTGRSSHRQIDAGKLARVKGSYESLKREWKLPPLASLGNADEGRVRQAIFRGFGDRVAKYRPMADQNKRKIRHYNFALGRGATLHESSAVQDAEWMVAIDAREAYGEQQGSIYVASAVDLLVLESDPFGLVRIEEEEAIDPKNGRASRVRRRMYGRLVLEESWEGIKGEAAADLLQTQLRKSWPEPFEDTEALGIYHGKLDLLNRYKVEHKLPRFEGEMLDLLIDFLCEGVSSLKELAKQSLQRAIDEQLDYEDRELLRQYFPDSFTLPSTRKLKIHYAASEEPWVASRLQDFFGQLDTPRICKGMHPLVVKLLAPSQRPAQITKDLRSFWQGSYQEVKKDLKRRYPKHAWPDDPMLAMAPPPLPKRER